MGFAGDSFEDYSYLMIVFLYAHILLQKLTNIDSQISVKI